MSEFHDSEFWPVEPEGGDAKLAEYLTQLEQARDDAVAAYLDASSERDRLKLELAAWKAKAILPEDYRERVAALVRAAEGLQEAALNLAIVLSPPDDSEAGRLVPAVERALRAFARAAGALASVELESP